MYRMISAAAALAFGLTLSLASPAAAGYNASATYFGATITFHHVGEIVSFNGSYPAIYGWVRLANGNSFTVREGNTDLSIPEGQPVQIRICTGGIAGCSPWAQGQS